MRTAAIRASALAVSGLLLASGCGSRPAGPQVVTIVAPFGHPSTITRSQLEVSASVLTRRLASLGKGHVSVTVDGSQLKVTSGTAVASALPGLLRAGRLEFRRVVEETPVELNEAPGARSAVASGDAYSPTNFTNLSCSDPQARSGLGSPRQPTAEIVACSKDGTVKYHLAIAKVSGDDIARAGVTTDQFGTIEVNLSFKGSGQDRWTNLTKEAYNQTPPTNQVAIVADGVVVTSPVIQGVINGDAVITGQFSEKQAEDLATTLNYGALPVDFQVVS